MSKVSTALTSACQKVQNQSKFLKVNGESKVIHVGSPQDMYAKIQDLKSLKEVSDKKVEVLEKDKSGLVRDLDSLRRNVQEAEETIANLTRDNDRLRSLDQSRGTEKSKNSELEIHNDKLQSSLQVLSFAGKF